MRRVPSAARFLCLALLFAGLTGCAGVSGGELPDGAGTGYHRYSTGFTDLFDTVTLIIGYAGSQDEFDRYAAVIYERMGALHRLFDIYHEYGGLNNLRTVNDNAGIAPVAVDGELIDLLLLAREGYELSGGAVNPALGPVLRIWHGYRQEGIADEENAALPPMDELRKAAKYTDMDDVVIDKTTGTVFLKKAGMSLDVGAVAKAYAAGLAAQAAVEAGMRSVLISAGGNIVSLGKPLDGSRDRWSIGIQDPDTAADGFQNTVDTVFIAGTAISCSGGYQRFYTVDGQAYHHIIDPDTLMPAVRYKQVTVIHQNPGLADILSTALFILPVEEGLALAEKCGADALWIDSEGLWRATDGYIEISQTLSGASAF
ncbi:MAG: FAD:protein FMN transferase [Oscillospiraceae bacterium]|jgi:thiamine biosynthesis lipoprotein|nr:FAD:protein FMN transferase [Oscillospiraceae bacterium]